MKVTKVALAAAPLLATAAVGSAAAATHHSHHYTPIVIRTDHKVCKKTVINGINDSGIAVGTEFCGVSSAFERTKSGNVTPISLPKGYGGRYVQAGNISSNDIVVLESQRTRTGHVSSFLYYTKAGVVVTPQDPAHDNHSVIVNSVNRHGKAVGYMCLNHKCSKQQPFTYRDGAMTSFALHRKGAVLPSLSQISDSGTLYGYFFQQPHGNIRGFVKKKGHHIRIIDAPHAGKKLGQGTLILGAGNHGTLCGDVVGKHNLEDGFVDRRGHMHLLNFHPGQRKSYTEPLACNSHGEVGGHSYNSHTKLNEGFLAKVG
jgi:hypothetical protein